MDKNNYTIWLFVGVAQTNLEQFTAAFDAFKKAVDIDSENVQAWKVIGGNLSMCLVELRKFLRNTKGFAELFIKNKETDKLLETYQKIKLLTKEEDKRREISLKMVDILKEQHKYDLVIAFNLKFVLFKLFFFD